MSCAASTPPLAMTLPLVDVRLASDVAAFTCDVELISPVFVTLTPLGPTAPSRVRTPDALSAKFMIPPAVPSKIGTWFPTLVPVSVMSVVPIALSVGTSRAAKP